MSAASPASPGERPGSRSPASGGQREPTAPHWSLPNVATHHPSTIPRVTQHNTLPSATPAIPQDPPHRLLRFFWVRFGVLVSFLGRNHEALLLPLHMPEDDRAAAVIFVVEDTGLTQKLGACFQPRFIKLLGWELANAFVLAEKRGETEMNKTQGTSRPAASFWAIPLRYSRLGAGALFITLGKERTNGKK